MGNPRVHAGEGAGPIAAGLLVALLGTSLAAGGCGGAEPDGGGGDGPRAAAAPASPAEAPEPPFDDRTAELGIDFVHTHGASGEYFMVEIMGSGAGLLDYDGDGDLDLYLVQGGGLEPDGAAPDPRRSLDSDPDPAGGDRLYRNLLAESGALAFEDVTEAAGLTATGYGMGVAVGDVDNDGDPDLYVTNYGPNQLWENRGDGTFAEVPGAGGADDPRWSVSATFVDYDRDGWLDLFVVNYLDFSPATHKECYAVSSALDYCGPSSFNGVPDSLFRNRGDGTFEDVSEASHVATAAGPGLGVVAGDLDGDGRLDLYVANDDDANRLWIHQGDGTFRDDAVVAGSAFNVFGHSESSMGIDAGDADGDGDDDLVLTHLRGESNTLYGNLGGGLFEDVSGASGLAGTSLGTTGFGAGFLDYDNDGWLDLAVVNGLVRLDLDAAAAGDPYPFRQTNQLWRNAGGGRFEEVAAGEAFAVAESSRGLALGDLDDDGDLDLVVSNNSGPAQVLVNRVGSRSRWLGLRLLDRGRDAYGARAALRLADGRTLWRRVRADGSYASASDPRLLFGLGAEDEGGESRPVALTVHWPDGTVESFDGAALAVGAYTALAAGDGSPEE